MELSARTALARQHFCEILIGELQPQQGEVRHGTHLEIAYFDQLRAQLDESLSILDNVGQGRDVITVNGQNRSLISYLEDFLFSRDRVHAPISALSGGERNRLLLARLFTRPANLLVMDEPTNDLDLETLELLEDLLLAYNGTLLLVSHDRTFLNNLVTSTLALDGSGEVREYVGGYEDMERELRAEEAAQDHHNGAEKEDRKAAIDSIQSSTERETKRKLSYKEQRALEALRVELEQMPERIEALETEQHNLAAAMADPSFYQQEEEKIAEAANRHKALEAELACAYQRWEELEQRLS